MIISKTAKVQAEIEKARTRLAEQQAKLKELESKRTEIENMEIVEIVRGMSIPLDELSAFLQSLKGRTVTAASGQVDPRLVNTKKTAKIETQKEEAAE